MIRLNIILIVTVLVLMALNFWPRTPLLGNALFRTPYTYFGGIETLNHKISLKGATSTPCSVRSPIATSTIVHASVNLLSSASSSLQIEIGKSANSGATTTRLGLLTLGANEFGSLVATTSLNDSDNLIISPLNFVNVRFGRPSGFANSYNGACEVIFRVL